MGEGDRTSFREQFADVIADLLDERRERQTQENPLEAAIREHVGADAKTLPIHGEDLPSFEHANLQLALTAALERPGWSHQVIGLSGQTHGFAATLGELVIGRTHLQPGPPAYLNAPVGPGKTLPCLTAALLNVNAPEGPLCVLVYRGQEHGMMQGLTVQALSPQEEVASQFLAD